MGIYRYLEVKSGGTETFVLESLLPDAHYDVHLSKLKLRNAERRGMNYYVPIPPPLRPPLTPPVPVEPHPMLD